ncbi:15580_t:CDS:2, partial [Funneliformis geosporum]
MADIPNKSIEEEIEGNENNEEENEGLPLPPLFQKFNHHKPLHHSSLNLPFNLQQLDSLPEYSIFSLFFSIEILQVIVKNTNIYASIKNA